MFTNEECLRTTFLLNFCFLYLFQDAGEIFKTLVATKT